MTKRKGLSYEEKLINSLKKLPNPIEDKRHGIIIVFENDRARSNQSRFEHIAVSRHELKPNDIKRIPKGIKTSTFRKDKERTNTYNLYIKRYNYGEDYIKISLEIDYPKSNIGIVKTIYIIKGLK